MYCNKCGSRITNDDNFCRKCGAKVDHERIAEEKLVEDETVNKLPRDVFLGIIKPLNKVSNKICLSLILLLLVSGIAMYSFIDFTKYITVTADNMEDINAKVAASNLSQMDKNLFYERVKGDRVIGKYVL